MNTNQINKSWRVPIQETPIRLGTLNCCLAPWSKPQSEIYPLPEGEGRQASNQWGLIEAWPMISNQFLLTWQPMHLALIAAQTFPPPDAARGWRISGLESTDCIEAVCAAGLRVSTTKSKTSLSIWGSCSRVREDWRVSLTDRLVQRFLLWGHFAVALWWRERRVSIYQSIYVPVPTHGHEL